MIRALPLFESPLVCIERCDHPPDVPHVDPDEERSTTYCISFVERGTFSVIAGRRAWTVGASELFVTVPGLVYRCDHHNNPDDVCLCVGFGADVDHSALNLRGLARSAGMSPFHFARVFRELTDVPPHRYLVAVRLRAAVERLRQGESVTDTCFAVGFNSLGHFIEMFRRTYGVSPSRFH